MKKQFLLDSSKLGVVKDIVPFFALSEDEDMPISYALFEDNIENELNVQSLDISKSIFKSCQFVGSQFLRCYFKHVHFIRCNFSNTRFPECTFVDCCFSGCKAEGAFFTGNSINSVKFSDSKFRYATFDDSSVKASNFTKCDCSSIALNRCKLKNFFVEETSLIRASFVGTLLSGIDFTSCDFEGIVVSDNFQELKGAIVNAVQAANLSKLLGVNIK